MLELHFINLRPDDEQLQSDWELLSSEERERAQRFAFPHLRQRYTAAHGALRRLLASALNASPSSLDFARGPQGKPFLPAYPELNFNLSHSGDKGLLGISSEQIGVDLEELRPGTDFSGVAQRFFTSLERTQLPEPEASSFTRDFLRLWTRKEAVTKCLGTGLRTPLDSFSVFLDDAPIIWHKNAPGIDLRTQEVKPSLDSELYVASFCISKR